VPNYTFPSKAMRGARDLSAQLHITFEGCHLSLNFICLNRNVELNKDFMGYDIELGSPKFFSPFPFVD
jgi:hypothetical protein